MKLGLLIVGRVHYRCHLASVTQCHFHYLGYHFHDFSLMYVQVGDFGISRGPPTVPLMQILHNVFLFKSQNPHKAGTLCIYSEPKAFFTQYIS